MPLPFSLFAVQHLTLATCLLLSGLACLICAYHLHHWPLHLKIPSALHAHDDTIVDISSYSGQYQLSQHQRYLSYIPHSGLHNQRIALENALTLAAILNRTLLLPPARLGSKPAVHYAPSVTLQRTLVDALLNSSTEQCSVNPNKLDWCEKLGNAIHVPWHWLVDFSSLGPGFKIWAPSKPAYPWIDGTVPLLEVDKADFYDTTLYAHRIVDTAPDESVSLGRYLSALNIQTLQNVSARHLCLGSLFGSARLLLRQPHHASLRRHVRANILLSNSLIDNIAAIVVHKLGGPNAYFAAHFRVSDGRFALQDRNGSHAAWFMLVSRALRSSEKAEALEWTLFNSTSASSDHYLGHYKSERVITPPLPSFALDSSSLLRRKPHFLPCNRVKHSKTSLAVLNRPLFLATDAQLEDPLLEQFTRTFPCTFTLTDLLPPNSTFILPRSSLSNATSTGRYDNVRIALAELRSSFDDMPLMPYLAPLLDGRIAAQAAVVAGTPESTFSSHIIDVGWPKAHGLEIAQRG